MLAWDSRKPTKEGWYWWRWDQHDPEPDIVRVWRWKDSLMANWGETDEAISTIGGQWAGPLEPPKLTFT